MLNARGSALRLAELGEFTEIEERLRQRDIQYLDNERNKMDVDPTEDQIQEIIGILALPHYQAAILLRVGSRSR